MTTATVTTAPTEVEIRAAIEASAAHYSNHGRDRLSEAVMEYADDLRWLPGDPDVLDTDPAHDERCTVLARDLRPSEADRLRTLIYEAEERATAACHDLIVREYTAAALAFVAEYPDAPRAERVAANG
jgi:hypothetical protein